MKKPLILALVSLSSIMLFTGCLDLQLGGGTTNRPQNPTIGQQLIDLQRARNAGAISEAQYQEQRAKLLGQK